MCYTKTYNAAYDVALKKQTVESQLQNEHNHSSVHIASTHHSNMAQQNTAVGVDAQSFPKMKLCFTKIFFLIVYQTYTIPGKQYKNS